MKPRLIALVSLCFVAVLGTLFGLQQIVTHQAQIVLEEYDTKNQESDSTATPEMIPQSLLSNGSLLKLKRLGETGDKNYSRR